MAEADYDISELSEMFEKAANHLKSIIGKLETKYLLELYGFYKQATEGSCNIPKPHWYEMQAKQKWEAWQALGNMTREDAMKRYVQIISELDHGWRDANVSWEGSGGKDGKSGWVAVSCMSNTDQYLDDADKTIFDWVKEGNVDKVWEFAQKSLGDSNVTDSGGMGLIHWAADRGNLAMLKCLIEDLMVNVDLKDGDGQTALHYAASCGHVDVVQFLLDNGADPNVPDLDGVLPIDVASCSEILSSLNIAN